MQHALRDKRNIRAGDDPGRTSTTHLSHLKLDSPNRLSIRNGKVGCQRGVADDGGQSVAMLVSQPLTAMSGVSGLAEGQSDSNRTHYLVRSACPWISVNYCMRYAPFETTYLFQYNEHALRENRGVSTEELLGRRGCNVQCSSWVLAVYLSSEDYSQQP